MLGDTLPLYEIMVTMVTDVQISLNFYIWSLLCINVSQLFLEMSSTFTITSKFVNKDQPLAKISSCRLFRNFFWVAK